MRFLFIAKQKKNVDTFETTIAELLVRGHEVTLAIQQRDVERDRRLIERFGSQRFALASVRRNVGTDGGGSRRWFGLRATGRNTFSPLMPEPPSFTSARSIGSCARWVQAQHSGWATCRLAHTPALGCVTRSRRLKRRFRATLCTSSSSPGTRQTCSWSRRAFTSAPARATSSRAAAPSAFQRGCCSSVGTISAPRARFTYRLTGCSCGTAVRCVRPRSSTHFQRNVSSSSVPPASTSSLP